MLRSFELTRAFPVICVTLYFSLQKEVGSFAFTVSQKALAVWLYGSLGSLSVLHGKSVAEKMLCPSDLEVNFN